MGRGDERERRAEGRGAETPHGGRGLHLFLNYAHTKKQWSFQGHTTPGRYIKKENRKKKDINCNFCLCDDVSGCFVRLLVSYIELNQ